MFYRSLAKIEEVRRATKRTAPNERDDYYVDRKRLSVDGRYDSARFVDPKSSSGSGHFGTSTNDYRSSGSKEQPVVRASYDARRFDRQTPTSGVSSTVITRRVVQEIRTRPPTSPPPPRDDRRVVDRGDR